MTPSCFVKPASGLLTRVNPPMFRPMTTIANCSLLIQAQLMQAALAGSGITAYIPDELTVQGSGSTYSLAIGGIRVQVEDEDVAAAREVLAALPPA